MRIHHITETEHDADTGQDFSTEKRELELFIMNDQDLYRQMFMPIIMNIVRKMKRGVYDHKLAPRLWQYLVDQGAKKYVMHMVVLLKTHFPKEQEKNLHQILLMNKWK